MEITSLNPHYRSKETSTECGRESNEVECRLKYVIWISCHIAGGFADLRTKKPVIATIFQNIGITTVLVLTSVPVDTSNLNGKAMGVVNGICTSINW